MELQWITWVQSFNTPFLDGFFELVTMLGEEYFYIVILSFFYWCVNKEHVKDLVMVLTFSSVVNSALKELINMPRPYLVENIRVLRAETAHGSSFPSGHTQIVATFYGALAYKYKSKWLWIVAIIVTIMVGVSRIYLGVHWPRDVFFAIILSGVVIFYLDKLARYEERQGVSWPYFVMMLIVFIGLLFLGSENYIKASGAFLGFTIGSLFEQQYIKFDVRASGGKQIAKFIMGMIFTLFVFEGTKLFLPEGLIYTWLRYFGTLFSVMALIPWLFIKTNLTIKRMFG